MMCIYIYIEGVIAFSAHVYGLTFGREGGLLGMMSRPAPWTPRTHAWNLVSKLPKHATAERSERLCT